MTHIECAAIIALIVLVAMPLGLMMIFPPERGAYDPSEYKDEKRGGHTPRTPKEDDNITDDWTPQYSWHA